MCEARCSIAYAVLVLLFAFGAACHAGYSGGTGEPNSPFEIATVADWQRLMNTPADWDKHFVLTTDIDLSGYTGSEFNTIGYYRSYEDQNPFSGVFDGRGHVISNFTYHAEGVDRVGLFSYVFGGEIKNLGLASADVNGLDGFWVGGLLRNRISLRWVLCWGISWPQLCDE